jgi:hypothetical protein
VSVFWTENGVSLKAHLDFLKPLCRGPLTERDDVLDVNKR